MGTVAEIAEISTSVRGVVFGVLSSLFVALYAIYVKKVLPVVGNNTWLLMIYNNINAGLLMPVCFVLMGEWTPIASSLVIYDSTYLGYIFAAGMLGFFINIVRF
jgi:GDP-fucose transporter C1